MDENYMQHYNKLTISNYLFTFSKICPKETFAYHSPFNYFFNDFTCDILKMVNLVNIVSISIWMEITCIIVCIHTIFIVVVTSSASLKKNN
jgi:uncharacterized integral membrane protein